MILFAQIYSSFKMIKIMADIQERVYKVIAEQLGIKEGETKKEGFNANSFTDDLGADSLDIVELVMALENEFDVEIPDDEAESITTVQGAIDHLTNALN